MADLADMVDGAPVQLCTLDKLCAGERARISTISRDDIALYHKLLTMGLVPGSKVEVSQVAPLGDPIAVRTTGHDVSLRLTEARMVNVIRGKTEATGSLRGGES